MTDILYNGIIDIVNHEYENWNAFRVFAENHICHVLNKCPQLEYSYINGYLFVNTQVIHDETIKGLLQYYKKIASSIVHPNDCVYKRMLPKIQSAIKKTNIESGNPWKPIFAPISSTQAFIEDLRNVRNPKKNRVVSLINDRGFKQKYFQEYDYLISDISEIETRYKSLVSVYKNWCIYHAYDSIYVIDRLLIDGLISVCNREIDVINNEDECYGAIMCCLTLLDKIILYYRTDDGFNRTPLHKYPNCLTYLLLFCFELISLYLKIHNGKDKLRTAECHVNRARLNDCLFYHDLLKLEFVVGTLMNDKYNPFDPTLLKALYIYDMDFASIFMPSEYGENYDYRMSANMMQQHREVAAVLPEGGDVFDTNYGDMCKIGEGMSAKMSANSFSHYSGVIEAFGRSVDDLRKTIQQLFKLNVRNISPYIQENKELGIKEQLIRKYFYEENKISMDKVYCFSYTHQIESFSKYGKVRPIFIPINFPLNCVIETIKSESKNHPFDFYTEPERTLLSNGMLFPKYHNEYFKENAINPASLPYIDRMVIGHSEEGYVKYFYCYGSNMRCVKQYIDWHHVFLGVPVSARIIDDSQAFMERLLIMVDFQIENDININ